MRILHVCPGQDTGGQAWGLHHLWPTIRPQDEVHTFVASQTYIGYPMESRYKHDAVQAAWNEADLVHLHNFPEIRDRFDHGQRKPLVMHWHGTLFRSEPERKYRMAAERGATQVVSTVDLLLSMPDGGKAHWAPQIVDVEKMREIRQARYTPADEIRVIHAPTDRRIKGTRAVQAAVRSLQRKGLNVRLVLIERQSWERCLIKKAQGEIFIDQMILGYGNNALEAWAMGMPVIAGARPEILARMRKEYGSRTLPFVQATEETVEAVLESLVRSPDKRAEWASRGMRHVEKFHAPRAAVERLAAIYEATGPSASALEAASQAAPAQITPLQVRPPYVPRYLRRRAERMARRAERLAGTEETA